MDKSKAFAAWLMDFREKNELAIGTMAKQLGVSGSTVSGWCLGTQVPRDYYLPMIARVTDASLDDVIRLVVEDARAAQKQRKAARMQDRELSRNRLCGDCSSWQAGRVTRCGRAGFCTEYNKPTLRCSRCEEIAHGC